MKKGLIIIIFLTLILAGCQANNNNKVNINNEEGKIILYYSKTCPHCQNVEKYLDDNNVRAKLDFIEKELNEDENNAGMRYVDAEPAVYALLRHELRSTR